MLLESTVQSVLQQGFSSPVSVASSLGGELAKEDGIEAVWIAFRLRLQQNPKDSFFALCSCSILTPRRSRRISLNSTPVSRDSSMLFSSCFASLELGFDLPVILLRARRLSRHYFKCIDVDLPGELYSAPTGQDS